MQRRPPMLGATGVDFGYKPAISVVLPRKRQPKLLDDACPAITLVCNSISASASKCDPFVDWLTGKSYLTYSGTFEFIRDDDDGGRTHDTITFEVTVDPETCEQTIVCSTVHRTKAYPDGEWVESDSASCDTGIIFEPYINQVLSHSGSISEGADFGTYIDTEESWSASFADEFTAEELISVTESALPDYAPCFGCDQFSDGCAPLISGQDCTCSAYLNLSEDEFSCSIRRFKYKFTFPSSFGFRLNWVERFTPGVGSPVDTPRTETISSPSTETTTYIVSEPATNGIITIEHVTCV